jgi:Flp pilus assembly protein TadG
VTRRTWSAFGGDRSAVTALEFALLAVPLMILLFGTVEFGLLFWAKEALQMTAIEGARCIGVRAPSCASGGTYSQASATNYIESVASAWGISLTAADLTLTQSTTTGACSGLSASMSEVTINYTFQNAVPGLLTMLAGNNTLTGHACFPKQP